MKENSQYGAEDAVQGEQPYMAQGPRKLVADGVNIS